MTQKFELSMTTLEETVRGSIDTATVMDYVGAGNRQQFVFDHIRGIVSTPITKPILVVAMKAFREYAKEEGLSLATLGGMTNRSRFINPNLAG